MPQARHRKARSDIWLLSLETQPPPTETRLQQNTRNVKRQNLEHNGGYI
jgi:hypothetical protein